MGFRQKSNTIGLDVSADLDAPMDPPAPTTAYVPPKYPTVAGSGTMDDESMDNFILQKRRKCAAALKSLTGDDLTKVIKCRLKNDQFPLPGTDPDAVDICSVISPKKQRTEITKLVDNNIGRRNRTRRWSSEL